MVITMVKRLLVFWMSELLWVLTSLVPSLALEHRQSSLQVAPPGDAAAAAYGNVVMMLLA